MTVCQPLNSGWVTPETRIAEPSITGAAACVPVPRLVTVVSARRPPVAERRFTNWTIDPTCTITVSPLTVNRRPAWEADVSVNKSGPWPTRDFGANENEVVSERGTMIAVSTDPAMCDPPIAGVDVAETAGAPGGTVPTIAFGVKVPDAVSA